MQFELLEILYHCQFFEIFQQFLVFLNGGKLSNFKLQENNYRIYDDLSNFLGLGFIVNETLSLKRLV